MAFYFIDDVAVWFEDEADCVAALVQGRFASIPEYDGGAANRASVALGPEQIQPSFEEAWPRPVWLASYSVASGEDAFYLNEDAVAGGPILAATIADAADTLSATTTVPTNATSAVLDQADTVAAALSVPSALTATVLDGAETLSSSLVMAVAAQGTVSDDFDTLSASLAGQVSYSLTATVQDQADTLFAGTSVSVSVTGATLDAPDTLSAAAAIAVSFSGLGVDASDTITASVSAPVGLSGGLQDASDTLAGVISLLAANNVTGAVNDDPDTVLSALAVTNEVAPVQRDGDGDIRRRRPNLFPRFRARKKLEDALEIVETVKENNRVSVNKGKIKEAIAVLKEAEPPPSYAGAIESITKALGKVSRETAKHQGLGAAINGIVNQIQAALAEMERKRLRRRREEELIVQWLLS